MLLVIKKLTKDTVYSDLGVGKVLASQRNV